MSSIRSRLACLVAALQRGSTRPRLNLHDLTASGPRGNDPGSRAGAPGPSGRSPSPALVPGDAQPAEETGDGCSTPAEPSEGAAPLSAASHVVDTLRLFQSIELRLSVEDLQAINLALSRAAALHPHGFLPPGLA